MDSESQPAIRLMIPDMPSARDLLPWLERIDRTRHYTNFGPLAREFEARIEERLRGENLAGDPDAVRVASASSGTVALELAATAIGLDDNAAVMVPALTFPGTATAMRRCRGRIVLVDVDPASWCLTPEIARKALDYTDVDMVVPVAGFGRPLPADDWDRFAVETGIPVLMDAAAAFGSQGIGRRCTTVFSLHATKTLCTGEGGLVVSCSEELIAKVRELSNFGFSGRGLAGTAGQNGKLSEYHAAVGLAQLARLDRVLMRRQRVWVQYRRRLSNQGDWLILQSDDDFTRAVFPVKIIGDYGAARLAEQLAGENVETRRWYYPPLDQQPAFSDGTIVGPGGCDHLPVTRFLGSSLLGLPFHSFLSDFEIARVCSLIFTFLGAGRLRRRHYVVA